MINPSIACLAALGLMVSLPFAASAQPASTATPQAASQPTNPSAARREEAAMTPAQRSALVEADLVQLRTQLAITPAQQTQWEAFAKITHENAIQLQERFQERAQKFARINAADNMTDYATISELHAVQLRRLAVSFQTLYASLSPEQKVRADNALRDRRTPGAPPG